MLVLADSFIAFFAFSLPVRGYNYAGFLINVPVEQIGKIHGVTLAAMALHLNRAVSYYGIGMRTYYFSVPILLWLFGSIWIVIATFGY